MAGKANPAANCETENPWRRRLAGSCVIFAFLLTPGCGRNNQPHVADAAPQIVESGIGDGRFAAEAARDVSVPSSGTSTALMTATSSALDTIPDSGSASDAGTTATGAASGTGAASKNDTGTASETATATGAARLEG
jgi:hypothetical protein